MTIPPFTPCSDCLTARNDCEVCTDCPVMIAIRNGTNRCKEVLPPNQYPETEDKVAHDTRQVRVTGTTIWAGDAVEDTAVHVSTDSLRIDLARIADALEYRNRPLRALVDYGTRATRVVQKGATEAWKFAMEVLQGG
jgi:hypothetical protein